MRDLRTYWDPTNNIIRLKHNELKASFENSLHMVGHTFNVILCKDCKVMLGRRLIHQS